MLSDKSVLPRKKVIFELLFSCIIHILNIWGQYDSTLHSLIWNLAKLGVVLQIALQIHNLRKNINSNFLSYFDRLKILNLFLYIYVFLAVVGGLLSWLVQKGFLCEVRHCKWRTLHVSKVIIKRVRFDGATLSGSFISLKAPGIGYDRDPALACK